MNTQSIETLIIGAGEAGLATGYHLKRRGRRLLIVDANARVGDNWRQQTRRHLAYRGGRLRLRTPHHVTAGSSGRTRRRGPIPGAGGHPRAHLIGLSS
jgi:cation diffusion facilitator CzcD-associated flavoprotein CzcO